MLERGGCRRSFPRCFSFSPILPSAVRLPSLLASGPVEETISESPHSGIQSPLRRNDRLRCVCDILRLELLSVVFECWRRWHRTSDGKTVWLMWVSLTIFECVTVDSNECIHFHMRVHITKMSIIIIVVIAYRLTHPFFNYSRYELYRLLLLDFGKLCRKRHVGHWNTELCNSSRRKLVVCPKYRWRRHTCQSDKLRK